MPWDSHLLPRYPEVLHTAFLITKNIKKKYTQKVTFNSINNFYRSKKNILKWNWLFFLTASTRHWRIKLLPVQFGVTVVIVLRGQKFYSTLLLNDQQKLTQWKKAKTTLSYWKKIFFTPHTSPGIHGPYLRLNALIYWCNYVNTPWGPNQEDHRPLFLGALSSTAKTIFLYLKFKMKYTHTPQKCLSLPKLNIYLHGNKA